MITHDLVIKMLDFVKDTSCGTFEYGKWGTLNMEQRKLIRRLCESWLILDEATNKQTLEIERLKSVYKKSLELVDKMYVKEKQINEYETLIFKIERYLNCYQYFLETQEENNKKIANMIHKFSLER